MPPAILEKLQRAGFVSDRERITERGHVARKTANAGDLPALLDHLAQAERLDVVAGQEQRLTGAWEDLVYALADGERARAQVTPALLHRPSIRSGE